MADAITFELVSPEKKLASAEARMVVIPGMEGDLGAMPDHAPFLTTLRPGVVKVETTGGQTEEYVVTGGFAEISENTASVLAEEALVRSALTREYLDAKIAEAEEILAVAKGTERYTAAAQRLNDFRGLAQVLGI